MRAVHSENTKPELAVRRLLHRLGHRFRLHRRDLPGKPDVVLPRHRLAIFVHGCFWHRHPGCAKATTPKSRMDFWNAKFDANVARDGRVGQELAAKGWRVMIVWGCETRSAGELESTLRTRLGQLGIQSGKTA
jgi:DNA mismatch endonuclease (patch repair protein)